MLNCQATLQVSFSKSNFQEIFQPKSPIMCCSMRVRRYYFALNRRGEVISSMDQNPRNTISPRNGYRALKQSENTPLVADGISIRPALSRSNSQRTSSHDSDTIVNQKSAASVGLFSEQSVSPSLHSSQNLLFYSVRFETLYFLR